MGSEMDCSTELHIKNKAKELFFVHGQLNATTQEIADYAKVNRTLVNYYFRSKKNLFRVVYVELMTEMKSNLATVYTSEVGFHLKIDQLIDCLFDFRINYPYMEIFNIQETQKLNNNKETIVQPKATRELIEFLKEIEKEMEKGTIKKYEPVDFIINVISMVSFPIVMRPIFSEIFALKKEDYDALLRERKDVIKKLIFN